MKRLALVLLLIFAICIPVARAEWSALSLDVVASHFAMRPVTILCRSEEEDFTMTWAWGYVEWPLELQRDAKVHEKGCLGALAIDTDDPLIPDWQKALGVAVLLHESFHLKHVRNAGSEKITECRTFRRLDEGMLLLGAEPEVLSRLMPMAIARHFDFVRRVPGYDYKPCTTPERYYVWLGE